MDLLTKHLDEAKAVGLSAAELYVSALAEFGGVASSLPSNPSAYGIFSWMKSNFAKMLLAVLNSHSYHRFRHKKRQN